MKTSAKFDLVVAFGFMFVIAGFIAGYHSEERLAFGAGLATGMGLCSYVTTAIIKLTEK